MRDPGTVAAFDRAENKFMSLIHRASCYVSLEKAYRDYDREGSDLYRSMADLYRFMVEETILTAGHLVNWCFDQGYLTRPEAFNIKHWLYWFADPEGFCEYTDYEEFRYEN